MFSFDEKEGSSFGIFAGLLQDIWSPDWVQTWKRESFIQSFEDLVKFVSIQIETIFDDKIIEHNF